MLRTWFRLLPLLLLIGSGILMLEGLPILTESVVEGSGLPFGTLISWLGISMFPLSILLAFRILRKPISSVYRFYHRTFRLLSLFALSWGLVSYLLAGNWAFIFSEHAGFQGSENAFKIFIYYTGILISLPLLFLLSFGIHHLILKMKKK